MTRPRLSTARELYGILGRLQGASQVQAAWNRAFAEQGMDAFMDRYGTSAAILPERLSEMFHFDRRVYLLAEDLQQAVLPLLDALDAGVQDRVNVVVNRGGVLTGYSLPDTDFATLHALLQSAHAVSRSR